jgi:hypothetical protein
VQCLLALHGIFEQRDPGTGSSLASPQITIHLHKPHRRQARRAVVLHKCFLTA